MPAPANLNPDNRSRRVRAIARTLLVQILILLVLAAAIDWYLDWSSETAFAEFSQALASIRSHARLRIPFKQVKAVQGEPTCRRGD